MDSVPKNNIISCSEVDFLYLPPLEDAFVRGIGEGENFDGVKFFCDIDGNQLIPLYDDITSLMDGKGGHPMNPVLIGKHLLDSLSIIPLEEAERFENKASRNKKGTDAETIKTRQRRIVTIIRNLNKEPEHLLDERGKDHIKDKVREIYVEEKKHEKIVDWLGYTLESFPESEKNNEKYKAKVKQFENDGLHSKQKEFFNKAWEKLYRENKETGYYELRKNLKDLFKDTEESK